MKIKCDNCGSELKVPGALVFGPPKNGRCKKLHVCVECWDNYVSRAFPNIMLKDWWKF